MPELQSRLSGVTHQASPVRISQLQPLGEFDFDASDLEKTRKRWSEDIRLYIDLAMDGLLRSRYLVHHATLSGASVA